MTERDPRTDPRPGDVLRGKSTYHVKTRTVTRRDTVAICWRLGRQPYEFRTATHAFCDWAATAEVIHKGDV